jgi:HPt (histidine-containing phosphotransfer) domain-containing protein
MEPVLDPAPLERLREMCRPGRPDLVGRVLELFFEDAPKRHQEIVEGLDEGATDQLHRAAHTLKSMAANVGAVELSRRAEKIEKAARDGRLSEVRALVESLGTITERAMKALRDGAEDR